MVETVALTPALGVEITGVGGVENLLDDASSQPTLHRATIAGDEAWS